MQKYHPALLADLDELLKADRAGGRLSLCLADLLGMCLVAHEQADGARLARHRHRARWLQRDVLAAYERAGYVPMGRKYFVDGLCDAVRQMQRDSVAHLVLAET